MRYIMIDQTEDGFQLVCYQGQDAVYEQQFETEQQAAESGDLYLRGGLLPKST